MLDGNVNATPPRQAIQVQTFELRQRHRRSAMLRLAVRGRQYRVLQW
jgi:hypothetical protein